MKFVYLNKEGQARTAEYGTFKLRFTPEGVEVVIFRGASRPLTDEEMGGLGDPSGWVLSPPTENGERALLGGPEVKEEEQKPTSMEFSPCIHCGHENPTHLEGSVACGWCGHQ